MQPFCIITHSKLALPCPFHSFLPLLLGPSSVPGHRNSVGHYWACYLLIIDCQVPLLSSQPFYPPVCVLWRYLERPINSPAPPGCLLGGWPLLLTSAPLCSGGQLTSSIQPRLTCCASRSQIEFPEGFVSGVFPFLFSGDRQGKEADTLRYQSHNCYFFSFKITCMLPLYSLVLLPQSHDTFSAPPRSGRG